jgi:hypothetical protein
MPITADDPPGHLSPPPQAYRPSPAASTRTRTAWCG